MQFREVVPVATAREAELLGALVLGMVASIRGVPVEGGVAQAVAELASGAHTAAVVASDLTRRWPSRAELAIAAYRSGAVHEDLPDTGDLRTDVLTLLCGVTERITSPQGQILRIIVSHRDTDPDLLREAREQLLEASTTRWLTVLGCAVARGQARPEALSPRIATLAVDLLRSESPPTPWVCCWRSWSPRPAPSTATAFTRCWLGCGSGSPPSH